MFIWLLLLALVPCLSTAQELEPRRWSHLPSDINVLGAGYAYTEADISDNPALRLENVQATAHTRAAKYIRTFELPCDHVTSEGLNKCGPFPSWR